MIGTVKVQVTGFFASRTRNLTIVVDIFSELWLSYLIAGTTGTDERTETMTVTIPTDISDLITSFKAGETYVATSSSKNLETGKKINSKNDGVAYVIAARSKCYVTIHTGLRAKKIAIRKDRYGREYVFIGTAAIRSWKPQA